MMRLFNPRLMFAFSEATSPYEKYEVFRTNYVIEKPPKRPANAYALFVKHTTSGMKGLKITDVTKTLAEQWNKMKPEDQVKAKFLKEYEEKKKSYQQVHQNYIQKYQTPFKMNTFNTMYVKYLYQNNLIKKQGKKKIEDYAKEVAEKIKTISEEDKKKFQALAEEQNKGRLQAKKKYQLPQRDYDTLTYFITKNTGPKEFKTQERKKELSDKYDEYLVEYKKKLEEFCKSNNYEMTGEQLFFMLENHKLQKKMQKKQRKPEETSEYSSEY